MAESHDRSAEGIPYHLIFEKRRTLTLQVDELGNVLVRAPYSTLAENADLFVREKHNWIVKKKKTVQEFFAFRQIRLDDHSSFPYLEGNMVISLCHVPFAIPWHGRLLLPADANRLHCFKVWRQHCAKSILKPRIKYFCDLLGYYPSEIHLSEASGSWGSMSQSGKMKLNSALIHYSYHEIDYVIVHELCHMKYMNHSDTFYSEMEKWIPDARKIQKELRLKGIPIIAL